MTRVSLRLGVLACLVPTFAPAQQPEGTRAVTDHYLELTLSRRYEDLMDVYATDAVFVDPTGEVFHGGVAQGEVRGARAIVDLQKGWGLASADLDVDASFTVGEYSVYRGTYHAGYESSAEVANIPFVTVLRAREGRIIERTDFGEYIESFHLGDRFEANTAVTEDVATRYLRAYLDGDLTTQAELLAPGAMFQDPTSGVFGPPAGRLFSSADAIVERRRTIYSNLRDFDLDVDESFIANHHAVFMGTVRYTLNSGVAYAQPAVFVVEVRDGMVTRHWDFVDYSVGPSGQD